MDITNFVEDDSYPITKIMVKEWREFAKYTIESRAIPSIVDGLKPVQRMYLYSTYKNAKNSFKKVSSLAGVLSDYGYNHGEQSGSKAGQLMAAPWNNNVCLVEGRGSFGTRLVQEAGAPRYVYTKVSPNFEKYIRDIELSPKHPDPEHEPPAFYVPIIPLVLVNGARGVATGFATNILPRNIQDVKDACLEYVKTGKITTNVRVNFPQFEGSVTYDEKQGRHYCFGKINRGSKTKFTIEDVPYGYDRETYIKILDKLEEDGIIVSYVDRCDTDGFCFDVKLKNSCGGWSDDEIIKKFKLVKPMTENLNVISPEGALKEYDKIEDIIVDFVKYRTTILEKRIERNIAEMTEELRWLNVKLQFVLAVLDDKIVFKNRKRAELNKDILENTDAIKSDIEKLLRLNIASLTTEQVTALEKLIEKHKKELKYWEKTTPKEQFIDDLKKI